MINLSSTKIYLATGHTDMRKGVCTLSLLADSILEGQVTSGAMFIFRGKSATKIKILWWDGQVASRSTQKRHLMCTRLTEMEVGPPKPLITRRLQTT